MRFTYKYFLILNLLFGVFACTQQNQSNQTTNSNKSEVLQDGLEYITLNSGKKILKAEKGVTVVNQTGWTNEQMSFQQDYCEQSVASVADVIHPAKFCSCFLSKIQYYYNPVYIKEAYADQHNWNQMCYDEAFVGE